MMAELDSCIDETKNLEPLYENLYQSQKSKYDRKTDLARDEKILNELTRAADEIMNVSRDKTLAQLIMRSRFMFSFFYPVRARHVKRCTTLIARKRGVNRC